MFLKSTRKKAGTCSEGCKAGRKDIHRLFIKPDQKSISYHRLCIHAMLTYFWDNPIICDVRWAPSAGNKNQASWPDIPTGSSLLFFKMCPGHRARFKDSEPVTNHNDSKHFYVNDVLHAVQTFIFPETIVCIYIVTTVFILQVSKLRNRSVSPTKAWKIRDWIQQPQSHTTFTVFALIIYSTGLFPFLWVHIIYITLWVLK